MISLLSLPLLSLPAMLACSAGVKNADSAGTAGTTPLDLRLTADDIPVTPEGGMTLWGPEVVIPPYSDKMFCYYGTYTGPDVGIHQFDVFQAQYGHHIVLFESTIDADTAPDGMVEDCTDLAGPIMTTVDPILFAPTFGAGENLFTMPEGMAAALNEGSRWMMQLHYVNTSDQAVLMQDAINLGLIPEDDVLTWTAPFAFTRTDLVLPPGPTTQSVECSVPDAYSVMFLLGHMHELGRHIEVERVLTDGSELLYSVDPWDASYRDAPPVNDYMSAPLTFNAGDTFRVTCTWENDTGEDVVFPHEMCASSGMLYPSKVPVICDN